MRLMQLGRTGRHTGCSLIQTVKFVDFFSIHKGIDSLPVNTLFCAVRLLSRTSHSLLQFININPNPVGSRIRLFNYSIRFDRIVVFTLEETYFELQEHRHLAQLGQALPGMPPKM